METFVTTVKLNKEKYINFKEVNIRAQISLQDFVNKCIELYVTNEDFQTAISESIDTKEKNSLMQKPFDLKKLKL